MEKSVKFTEPTSSQTKSILKDPHKPMTLSNAQLAISM